METILIVGAISPPKALGGKMGILGRLFHVARIAAILFFNAPLYLFKVDRKEDPYPLGISDK